MGCRKAVCVALCVNGEKVRDPIVSANGCEFGDRSLSEFIELLKLD